MQALITRLSTWLPLAAAPTFAGMALMTMFEPAMCMAAGSHPPLGPMAQMYLLMAAFHTGPWLKLTTR